MPDAWAGKPVIRFNGQAYMKLPAADQIGVLESDYEIFLVARSSSVGLQNLLADDQASVQLHSLTLNNSAGATFVPNGLASPSADESADLGAVGQYTDGSPHLFDLAVADNAGYLYVDGLSSSDVVKPAMSLTECSLYLGNDATLSTGLVGDIAEVLIYSRALDPIQRSTIQQYLSDRWDLTLVPEPSALLLWLLGVSFLGRRLRRPS